MNLENRVKQQYSDFGQVFNRKIFPEVFKVIDEKNRRKNSASHRYGGYAILYTKVQYQPKIMIIGNNPSWFNKDSVYEAHQIVNELMKAPPVENSYLTHNHVFAHRLTDAFNRVGRHDLLREAVGMNRLWLQTGQSQTGWTRALKSRSPILGMSLVDYCESKTLEIIKEITPKVLLLVGAKAQQLNTADLRGTETSVENVSYPLGGGITALARELESIVKIHGL